MRFHEYKALYTLFPYHFLVESCYRKRRKIILTEPREREMELKIAALSYLS